MMIRTIYISILATCIAFSGYTQPVDLLKKGNQAYINGNYEKAIELYTSVVDSGYKSAALYFNLGNAYFKSNKIPHAILHYERARLLDPNDEEIEFNLELANTFTVDKIEEIPELFLITWLKSIIHLFKVDTWAFVSIGCFIVFLVGLSVYFFSKKYHVKRFSFWLGALFLALSIISYTFGSVQKNEITSHSSAIIFAPTITLKSSPDKQSTDLFVLHEGTKVEIVDEVGEWREIKLADGSKGWLKISNIEII